MSACANCSSPLMPGKVICQKCGSYSSSETANVGGSVGLRETEFLGDVEAKALDRIVTGGPWDPVWGGGFVPTGITLMGGAAGAGKMLRLDTPITTVDGWTTMGAIRVGDQIFDENGEVCRVVQVNPIVRGRTGYAVKFSDGEVIVADADHLWRTWTANERQATQRRTAEFRAARRSKRSSRGRGIRSHEDGYYPKLARWRAPAVSVSGTVRTTAQIAATLRGLGGRLNHSIDCTYPLALPDVDLPAPPYTLGVWLGDGTRGAGEYTGEDPEIADHVRADGYEVAPRKYGAKATKWSVYGVAKDLRAAGVLHSKHIPSIYLRASIAQRLELLRGLMDTDGDCTKFGGSCFNTTSPRLRDGFAELAASLGIKTRPQKRKSSLNGHVHGPSWRFEFSTDLRVFKLSRKLERQRVPKRGTHRRRYIVSVRSVGRVPMRCIAVDSPSKLYLAGRGMIPTHNTTLLLQLASIFVEITKKSSWYLSAEQASGELRITADRLELPNIKRIRVLKKFGSGAELDEEMFKQDPPGMMILDSISALCGKDVHAAIAICKRYKGYSIKYNAPSFLISHMTKEGDFAGLMALQHEVDTLVTLFPEEDGSRVLKPWKNRYGATHAEFKLMMTQHGLIAMPVPGDKKKRAQIVVPEELQQEIIDAVTQSRNEGKPASPERKLRLVEPPGPNEMIKDGQHLVRRPKLEGPRPLRTYCGECGARQIAQPVEAGGGVTCPSGHVGAKTIKRAEAEKLRERLEQKTSERARAIEGEALKKSRPAMPRKAARERETTKARAAKKTAKKKKKSKGEGAHVRQ